MSNNPFFINFVPCPPFFVENIYEIFIDHATNDFNQLDDVTIAQIIVKCSIEIPATTTTTTTTTTTPTTPTSTSTTTTPPTSSSTSPSTPSKPPTSSLIPETSSTSKNEFTSASTSTSTGSTNRTTDVPLTSITSTPSSSSATNIFTSRSSTFTSATTKNVTMTTETSRDKVTGCSGVCLIGIITGAICLAILLLLIIGLAVLFRRGKGNSKKLHRSHSKGRYGYFPDTDLYDSIDIEDISYNKRNSGSALMRRSGDFSKSPLVFDNPAYRRSFELRPNKYNRNSWYDPDATNYAYSQQNANLVSGTPRSPENRRSLSTSHLNDRELYNGRDPHWKNRMSISDYTHIRDYVPKSYYDSDGSFGHELPYHQTNGSVPNGIHTKHSSRRSLPRTPIENYQPRSEFKASHRSRSFDPHFSDGSWPGNDDYFIPMDNIRSRSRYTKNSPNSKRHHRSRKDKHMRESKKVTQNGFDNDRHFRSRSHGRDNHSHPKYSNYTHFSDRSDIISSNLQPVSYIYSDSPPYLSDRTNTHFPYEEKSRKKNDKRKNSRHSSQTYNNNTNMYTTKL